MKIYVYPRVNFGDFVLMLYASATEFYPEHPIRSKNCALPPESPALVNARTDGRGWHYKGKDAEDIYNAAPITDGEELPGYLEQDYEAIRASNPASALKPYNDLTPEEKGKHRNAWLETMGGFSDISNSIKPS